MKITKIRHFYDPSEREIEEAITEKENLGFEVVQVSTAACKGASVSTSYVTIVFQKEKE